LATHPQAEKRARQNLKRRANNRLHKTTMRTTVKKVRAAIAEGDTAEAAKLLPEAVSRIASVASHGAIHRNTAARTIARLTRAVNKAQ
jgi:small subunit ribosomal protein S20